MKLGIDTYGLPTYRTTKVITERVGDEIHLLCGSEMFGQTQWSHMVVIRASDMVMIGKECHDLAVEAISEDLKMALTCPDH